MVVFLMSFSYGFAAVAIDKADERVSQSFGSIVSTTKQACFACLQASSLICASKGCDTDKQAWTLATGLTCIWVMSAQQLVSQ